MFKQLRQSNVAKAVRYALFSGVTLSMLPTYATAQEEQGAEEPAERISVTGSRLQKAEFDQAAPVQVLEIDSAVKAGISTVAELLQRTSLAGGQQFDATYNSNSGNSNASEAPPTGGVGSSNVGLRGLGPERTLILVNGRRLGSSGVRGAPAQPDLSLLPLNMVERIEIITEGASSIYGADAVAGVINVILKTGMEGTEISANVTKTKDGGGAVRQFSFVTGQQTEKSSFVISGSYYNRERVAVGSRADGCIRWMVHDTEGNIYDACRNRYFNNAALNFSDAPDGGDIFAFYTPGSTNIGVPNWTTGAGLPAPNYDYVFIEGSGRNNYTYIDDYHDQWDRFNADLIQPATRYTLAVNGNIKLDLFGGDEEFFYETYYFHRHLTNQAASEQQIPTIPGMIPKETADGSLERDANGDLVMYDNPFNPFTGDAMPVVTIDELSQKRDVELDHIRVVAGLRGDFTSPTLNEKGWNYEVFASYDRGMGHQSQPVLHEEHLFISNETLRLDVDGNVKCGLTGVSADYGGILTLKECVPVNWFADNIYSVGERNGGSFGSDAEREYLIATRTNRTVVEQTMFSAFATGELFDFDSGGTTTMAFGAEYRRDDIWSAVDYLGATGGNAGENPLTEGASIGTRDVRSAFAEVYLPFILDQSGFNELSLEAAARYTKESNFGNETTYRARLTYKPTEEIILSASYGTSFRAPNLREQFLGNQFQGIGGSADPCSVPGDASAGGVYDPANDNRPQVVIDNCLLDGADPFTLGLNGILNIPVNVGGNALDLEPETTDNYSYSFKWNPEFDGPLKMNFAITFFDIEIENTIQSINAGMIMNRCYYDAPGLQSRFCERITRNGEGKLPSLNFVSEVDASFLNVGLETSKGFDINFDMSMSFGDVFGEELTVTWTNIYTQMSEREITIFAAPSDEELAQMTAAEQEIALASTGPEEILGDFGYNEHRLATNLTFDLGNFSWLLSGRYISGTHADETTAETWACDRYTRSTDILVNGERPLVQPICTAGGAFYLDTSVTWSVDNMRISAGITNVLDKKPPLVSMFAGSNRSNMVTSSGYDLMGQGYFLNMTYSF